MYDVAIIGGGPGGFDTALYAKSQGLDVILFEKGSLGGTCLNWGCIPTKAIYHNAETLKKIKEANAFGINVDSYSLDLDVIRERKESIVQSQVNNIRASLKKSGITLVEAIAELVDTNTIQAGSNTYQAKNIIIATGSVPNRVPFIGSDLDVIKTSKDILELNVLPPHLTIIGAGVIGIEMASIFNELGSTVDVIEYLPSVLPQMDKDISKRAKNLLKRSGINFHTNSMLKKVEVVDGNTVVTFLEKNKEKELTTDYLLLATGRKAYFGGLDLDNLGINYTKKGISVNESKQTNIPNIFAIGDVNGENMLAHKATYDGYQVVNHIVNSASSIRFDLVPGVVFSFPEIASVGLREDDLEKGTYTVHKTVYKSNAKAQCMNETEGFVKIIIDDSKKILGVHIIGAHASDLIHECTVAMNLDADINKLFNVIHAHPTISEVLSETFKHLNT